MTQTCAIFLEAYRSLNAKKLFWVVLILSGLVAGCFACVGLNEHGLKLLFWQFDNEMLNSKQVPVDQFYKTLFVQIGIGTWLSWVAAILALISTAGIFPDLMTAGSIDLFVSKPIGRLRLFFTEYLAGLLFAALQVTIFTVACFLVIGLRGGVWEPGLFLAIPIVVCFFSYLFSVCVFLGVATRSTIAALLLTLLFWFAIWMVGVAERGLLMVKTMQQEETKYAAAQREEVNRAAIARKTPNGPKSSPPADPHLASKTPSGPKSSPPADQHLASKTPSGPKSPPPADPHPEHPAAEADAQRTVLNVAHNIFYGIKTVLPKTTDTIELLERSLMKAAQLPQQSGHPQERHMMAAQQEVIDTLRGRSIAWVVGTSLGFEALVLAFAALIFCRRDY